MVPPYRYCQNPTCATQAFISEYKVGEPYLQNPCVKCGGTNFDSRPPKNPKNPQLTSSDIIFLRCQGIKAEW